MKTFPDDPSTGFASPSTDHEQGSFEKGLTKREYFAAAALQGALSNSRIISNEAETAKWAVGMADALIDALNK